MCGKCWRPCWSTHRHRWGARDGVPPCQTVGTLHQECIAWRQHSNCFHGGGRRCRTWLLEEASPLHLDVSTRSGHVPHSNKRPPVASPWVVAAGGGHNSAIDFSSQSPREQRPLSRAISSCARNSSAPISKQDAVRNSLVHARRSLGDIRRVGYCAARSGIREMRHRDTQGRIAPCRCYLCASRPPPLLPLQSL